MMLDNYEHHSPSRLNLYCACPSMFTAEYICGRRQPVGAAAHRGTAVERAVLLAIEQPGSEARDWVNTALEHFDVLMRTSTDLREDFYRNGVPAMTRHAAAGLRPYGKPTQTQGLCRWHPPGLRRGIIGYYDFYWRDHGIIVDLKTTERMPSVIKTSHARQVSFYAGAGEHGVQDARLAYVTPREMKVLQLENVEAHRTALYAVAQAVEGVLSLSDDPEFYLKMFPPDLDSFYWNNPAARALAFDLWKI